MIRERKKWRNSRKKEHCRKTKMRKQKCQHLNSERWKGANQIHNQRMRWKKRIENYCIKWKIWYKGILYLTPRFFKKFMKKRQGGNQEIVSTKEMKELINGKECKPRGGGCHWSSTFRERVANVSISSVLIIFTELGLTQMLVFTSRRIELFWILFLLFICWNLFL